MKRALLSALAIVLLGALGSYVGGVMLAWAPAEVVWSVFKAVGSGFWKAVSITFPVSVIVVLALTSILFVLSKLNLPALRRLFVPKKKRYTIPGEYVEDEMFGVLWTWDSKEGPKGFTSISNPIPHCPKADCRAHLRFERRTQRLHCTLCQYQVPFPYKNPVEAIQQQIISRIRTGTWLQSQQRIDALVDRENPT